MTQQELDFRFEKLQSASKILSKLLAENKIEGSSEIQRKKLIQWSILQHYEVTFTPLIDVTQSLRVACSFAQLHNEEKTAFIYVFGLPYYSNRISSNSEHDLVNIRLLSICPPQALRPYFQEGYLVGTEDITNDYLNKGELDLNNRIIAKFEIPNTNGFWGNDFNRIPESALYPKSDKIESICKEIKQSLITTVASSSIGDFLKLWSDIEYSILNDAKYYNRSVYNVRDALYTLLQHQPDKSGLLKEFDFLRKFRNKLVHNPTAITDSELQHKTENLRQIKNLHF